MRKAIVFLILLGLGIVLLVFTLRNIGVSGVIESLHMLSGPESVIVFLVLLLGQIVVGAMKWKTIIGKTKDKGLKFSKIFLARWAGFGVSFVTPAALLGGEPVRFLILKQGSKLETSKIISSIILDKLLFVFAGACYFFTGIFFLLIYLDLSWLMLAVGLGILLAAMIAFWLLLRKARKISKEKGLSLTIVERLYLNKLKIIKKNQAALGAIEAEMRKFFRSSRLPKVLVMSFMEVSIVVFGCWLILFFAGLTLEIPKLFAIKSMSDLSYSLPFPAALGTLEISQAFVFGVLGFSLAMGVAFSLVLRGLNLAIALLGLLILSWLQIKFFKQRIIDFLTGLVPNSKQ